MRAAAIDSLRPTAEIRVRHPTADGRGSQLPAGSTPSQVDIANRLGNDEEADLHRPLQSDPRNHFAAEAAGVTPAAFFE
jgi:hypothetical protein